MPVVRFTSNLKRFYPNLIPFSTNASSLPMVLEQIDNEYPGIKDYVVDEQGKLRNHVNIFINNHLIKDRELLGDEVNEQDEVFIMQALSGG